MRSRRKALGQNFLADRRMARRIVDRFTPRPGDRVLEVGPGRGALTDLVAGDVAVLVAVERDAALAAALCERYHADPRVRIVEADVLEVDLDGLPFDGKGPVRVLSNLPYSVATAILERLLRWGRASDLMVMVQREVADRIEAPPGSRERGYLSVLTSLFCEVRRLLEVPPGAFRPPPKVHSAMLALRPRPFPDVAAADKEGLLRLASAGFAHRRKTLYNNLRSAFQIERGRWEAVCLKAALDARVRAEDLDLPSWAGLRRALLLEGVPLGGDAPSGSLP